VGAKKKNMCIFVAFRKICATEATAKRSRPFDVTKKEIPNWKRQATTLRSKWGVDEDWTPWADMGFGAMLSGEMAKELVELGWIKKLQKEEILVPDIRDVPSLAQEYFCDISQMPCRGPYGGLPSLCGGTSEVVVIASKWTLLITGRVRGLAVGFVILIVHESIQLQRYTFIGLACVFESLSFVY
jgi:hypothetical protein